MQLLSTVKPSEKKKVMGKKKKNVPENQIQEGRKKKSDTSPPACRPSQYCEPFSKARLSDMPLEVGCLRNN